MKRPSSGADLPAEVPPPIRSCGRANPTSAESAAGPRSARRPVDAPSRSGAHAEVPVNQKLFKRVVLGSDHPDVLGTLLLLSKAQLQGTVIDDLWSQYFVDRQVKRAAESLSGIEPASDFLRLIRKRVPKLSLPDVCASLARARLTLDYPAGQQAPPAPAWPKAMGAGQACLGNAAKEARLGD